MGSWAKANLLSTDGGEPVPSGAMGPTDKDAVPPEIASKPPALSNSCTIFALPLQ
jgi:hypothetical protein